MSTMADICRCCLKSSNMLVDIFAERHEDEPSLAVMLRNCGDCEVKCDDALPKQLCLDCVLATQNAFRLKRSLLSADSGVFMEAAEEYGLLDDSDVDLGSSPLTISSSNDNQENGTPTANVTETATKSQRYSIRELKLERCASEDRYSSNDGVQLFSARPTFDMEALGTPRSRSNNRAKAGNTKRPCKCPFPRCTADFMSNKGLNAHMRRHGKRTYICDSCAKAFVRKYDLEEHMRIHTGERPFKCPHCTQSFTWNSVLKLHIRTHTGERPFRCVDCSKTFVSSHSLNEHQRVHTNNCAFECPDCSRSFKHNKTLKRHILGHTKDTPKRQSQPKINGSTNVKI